MCMGNSTSEIVTKEQFGQTVRLWEKNSLHWLQASLVVMAQISCRVHIFADSLISARVGLAMQWSSATEVNHFGLEQPFSFCWVEWG